MISYKASVAQICVLFRFNDRQWSLTIPRSPKYVSFADSLIVNDLLQCLGRPNVCLIYTQWSSMISFKASVAHICFLFVFYDRQWSLTKPRSPKYVSFFRLYDPQWSPTMPQSPKFESYLNTMIVNDLLKSLGRSYMLFIFYDRQWSPTKLRSPKYVYFLDSIIVNDLLQCLSCLNLFLIWTQWSLMIF